MADSTSSSVPSASVGARRGSWNYVGEGGTLQDLRNRRASFSEKQRQLIHPTNSASSLPPIPSSPDFYVHLDGSVDSRSNTHDFNEEETHKSSASPTFSPSTFASALAHMPDLNLTPSTPSKSRLTVDFAQTGAQWLNDERRKLAEQASRVTTAPLFSEEILNFRSDSWKLSLKFPHEVSVCICIYTYAYVNVYVYVHVCAYVNVYVYVYVYIYMYTATSTHALTYASIRTHTRLPTNIHTHIYTYTGSRAPLPRLHPTSRSPPPSFHLHRHLDS